MFLYNWASEESELEKSLFLSGFPLLLSRANLGEATFTPLINWSSTMEAVKKSRGNSFWTIAVILNILFSVISVGFFIYKVHVLEGELFQLRSDLKNQAKARESEDANLMNRNKRAAEYHGESKTCTSCHNACVQLFGLGASAKVFIKISKLHMLSFYSFW